MTCIVGVETDSGALLAGDSASVGSHHTKKTSNSKVFKYDDVQVACGYTTSFRMGQILEYHLDPPEVGQDERDYLVRVLVPEIRETLEEKGFSKIKNNKEKGGMFLLAVGDKVFKVQGDFSAIRHECPYSSVGLGAREAYGAMAAMKEDNPKELARRAIEAASEFNTGVELPITTCQIYV